MKRIPAAFYIFLLISSMLYSQDINYDLVEKEILYRMKEWHLPGMSICVIKDGEVKWHKGIGVKNIKTGEPVNEKTIFQAASMSKPVFAYTVLKICDEGLLDLDTPLVKYADEEYIEKKFLRHPMNAIGFKKEWFSKITARMVLSHSSGLQHFGLKNPAELLFEPGTKFYYSSNGIEYLRYIIEQIKGKQIDTLIAEYVFKPLDMKYSSFSWQNQYEFNSAPGHNQYNETTGTIEKYSFPTAQASLYTNAQDYGKFLLAILKGKGLKENTYKEMIKPQIQTNTDVYWGLGVAIEIIPGGKGIWHWGDGGTHTCYFYCDLVHNSGFVYFVNSFYGLGVLEDIFTLFSKGKHPALTFSVGDWSFREDSFSPYRRFLNILLNEPPARALEYYNKVASMHEKGLRFINETLMLDMITQLLIVNKIPETLVVLELLFKIYYPTSLDTCLLLSHKYEESKSTEVLVEYLRKINSIIINNSFNWALDKVIAGLIPFNIKDDFYKLIIGNYPPYQINYDSGHLYFKINENTKYELVPLKEDIFFLKDVDGFKVQFIKEDKEITSLKGIWLDGRTRVYKKK